MSSPIILALDTKDKEIADSWISATKSTLSIYKIGLELFLNIGISGAKELVDKHEIELFLDLKFHDIPNTVAQAVESVKTLNPKFLTIHASGGPEMISAAARAAGKTSVTAVTILTSLSDVEVGQIGFAKGALDSAVNLAKLATESGATSIVCSPFEVAAIRSAVDPATTLITPGVRPADSESGDQKRFATPKDAITNGANYVVIGRPITSYAQKSLLELEKRAAELHSQIV
jgi:orotidine-5'-phosphate decarboxylase